MMQSMASSSSGASRHHSRHSSNCGGLAIVAIKAAVLLAQPDKRLLKAYLEIKGVDQRYKQEPEE